MIISNIENNVINRYINISHSGINYFSSKLLSIQSESEELYESTPLEEAVLALPVKFKEVITYYYYEGFSIKEIAQILGTNENTIKSRMKKAKQLLKEALDADEMELMTFE